MPNPKTELRIPDGSLSVGSIPRVVGTLSLIPNDFPLLGNDIPSDIVEVRLDEMQEQHDWLERCISIEAVGLPVILTTRLASEGGKWEKADTDRLGIFQKALESLSAVDVEFKSEITKQVSEMAKNLQKTCIVSYHNFDMTPRLEQLESVLSQAQELASVVKISTMIKEQRDIDILRNLLSKEWEVPVCVIGMGSIGTQTRITFATTGSCMTYGYLDKPSAPGQLPARTLVSQLRTILPAFNEDYIGRKQILECV